MLNKTIFVVAAHPKEIKGFKNQSLSPYTKLSVCGVGRQARHTSKSLKRGRQRKEFIVNMLRNCPNPPSLILNIGFAGALSKKVSLGDLVLSNEFLRLTNSTCHRLKIDYPSIVKVQHFFNASPKSFHQGAILTVDEPITNTRRRDELFKITTALAVDMESFYLAESTTKHALSTNRGNIPFLSLKIISDRADESARKMVKLKASELSEKLAQATCNLLEVL